MREPMLMHPVLRQHYEQFAPGMIGKDAKSSEPQLRQQSPLPFDRWPAWAKLIAGQREAGEKGVGDTAARLFGKIGGDAFKVAFKTVFKVDCGCSGRQQSWNLNFPYTENNVDF